MSCIFTFFLHVHNVHFESHKKKKKNRVILALTVKRLMANQLFSIMRVRNIIDILVKTNNVKFFDNVSKRLDAYYAPNGGLIMFRLFLTSSIDIFCTDNP